MKYLILLISAFSVFNVYADCKFVVVNDTLVPIKVEAGYFRGTSESFDIPNAAMRTITIKSDKACGEINSAHNLTYINMVGGQSEGGWVYDSKDAKIRAVGEMRNSTSVTGRAPDGREVMLITSEKPSVETFSVKVKTARSTSRQNASLND